MVMKDWKGNGKSTYVTIGASNHSDGEREEHDFYATSPEAVDGLVGAVGGMLCGKVWECACGTGCLSGRLIELGYDVVSTDLVDRGYGGVIDFLEADDLPDGCGSIVTNPPYKYASEFVRHSLELLPKGGVCAMFLKTTFLEGQRRYDEIFKITPPEYMLQFSKRVKCAKNADFSSYPSSAIAYAWYVWRKGFTGNTVVKWI